MNRAVSLPVALGILVLIAAVIAAISWFGIPGASREPDGPMVCEDDSVSSSLTQFGHAVEDLSLVSMSHSPVMLHDLGGERFTVVVFVSYTCPCSDGYVGRLRDLRTRYEARGVGFVAIHSSANEDLVGMQRYIKRKNYPFPVFRDDQGVAADAMSAAVTPEAFVFDSGWRLQYHGRIDDEKSGASVIHHTLDSVLDTLTAGANLITREQPALGCAIVRTRNAGVE